MKGLIRKLKLMTKAYYFYFLSWGYYYAGVLSYKNISLNSNETLMIISL